MSDDELMQFIWNGSYYVESENITGNIIHSKGKNDFVLQNRIPESPDMHRVVLRLKLAKAAPKNLN